MMKYLTMGLVALLALGHARAAEWTELVVFPPHIKLHSAADFQHVIAVARRSDGITVDVTGEAQWQLEHGELARLQDYRLLPVADGQTVLSARWQGLQAQVAVEVSAAADERPISFHLDVMPVLTRTGCNTGSCHGAARGKDGFRLSLFGFDPAGDHYRITREIGTRRMNLARPDHSLIYLKSIGAVPHTGGRRMQPDKYAQTLLAWLEGVIDSTALRPANGWNCIPDKRPPGRRSSTRLVAVAHFSDGTTRDVSSLAYFSTNNDRVAEVTDLGAVTAGVRGEAFVMARYDTHTVGTQVITLPADLDYQAPEVDGNYIDELIADKLQKLRILPSGLCADEEFLRRATIDIIGLLPTEEEYAEFLADPSDDKRARLIDRLLDRKEFSEIWAMKWAQLLMVKSDQNVSYKAAFLYSSWLTNQLASNRPIHSIVRELLACSGGVFNEPATNFYQVERDTLKVSENVAQVFMGIRTQCAQCHNHPFDRWTMDDYYGFASFFTQIGRKTGEDYRETIVFDRGGGEVNHPVRAPRCRPAIGGARRYHWPRSPGGLGGVDHQPENLFFSTSIANRVWGALHGCRDCRPGRRHSRQQSGQQSRAVC